MTNPPEIPYDIETPLDPFEPIEPSATLYSDKSQICLSYLIWFVSLLFCYLIFGIGKIIL